MATNWYYADSSNQQCGPVDSDWLSSAFRSGNLAATTLVWREGLAGWLPIAQVAGELGLGNLSSSSPPATPAGREAGKVTIAKPASSRVGLVVGLAVGFFFLIAVLGIVAAIALPAYQDYTIRARVTVAYAEIESHQPEINAFFANHGRCPQNGDAGYGSPESYALPMLRSLRFDTTGNGECRIEAILNANGVSVLAGKSLSSTMDEHMQWTAHSNLPARYLPLALRSANSASR